MTEPSDPAATVAIHAHNNGVAAMHIDSVYQGPTAVYEVQGRAAYLERARSTAEQRARARRRGAGLDDDQVQRTLGLRAPLPPALRTMEPGSFRVLCGPLGAGKSDIAETWHGDHLAAATTGPDAAVPVWIGADELATSLHDQLVAVVGYAALEEVGANVVIDGLDERTDRAGRAIRQAAEFVSRWPKCQAVLTSRQIREEVAKVVYREDVVVDTPPMAAEAAATLMRAVAGGLPPQFGPQFADAFSRPLFAILAAAHAAAADGAAGLPELIDLMVRDVVAGQGWDLYAELRRLAVATVRQGRPVDPAAFETADVVDRIRKSPLVATTGNRCAFALATFEQWFAAKALLEGEVAIEQVLTSVKSFDRWKYVLAMVLSTGEPSRADAVMAAVARWNPGAATWIIDEARRGGLRRRIPIAFDKQDLQELGDRVRTATQAWLDGLGPALSGAFHPFRTTGTTDFARASVCVAVDHRLTVTWLTDRTGQLPPVVPDLAKIDLEACSLVMRTHQPPTTINWVWEVTQRDLAIDISGRFSALTRIATEKCTGVIEQEAQQEQEARLAQMRHADDPSLPWQIDDPLYPYPDIPPSQENPWGAWTVATLQERAAAVIEGAMAAYLELCSCVAPNFGVTLAHRGLMPAEFYGTMFYEPDQGCGYDDHGPREPGFRWLLRPTGAFTENPVSAAKNTVALNVNDAARAEVFSDDDRAMYSTFMQYLDENPEFADFAGPFIINGGGLDVLAARPATRIAVGWLWEDLKLLGWVTGSPPID